MAGFVRVIWGRGEVVYFCERDWIGQITLISLNKLGCARKRLSAGLTERHKLKSRPATNFVRMLSAKSKLQGWLAPLTPRVLGYPSQTLACFVQYTPDAFATYNHNRGAY